MGVDRSSADPIRLEIGESGWLVCGLLWVVAGALAIAPWTIVAQLGRSLLELMLLVHTIEAGYVTVRAWANGFSARLWFLRTFVLGSLAVFTLETGLRRIVSRKETV